MTDIDNKVMKAIELLLVEDNPGDIRLTKEALKASKIFVKLNVVSDGNEAMRYLRKEGEFESVNMPDMVLLDLNLPQKSGREVLAEIKNDPNLKRIPVVVLTTSKADEDIIRSYDAHANCYITKPIDIRQLINIVVSIQDFWFTIVKLPPHP